MSNLPEEWKLFENSTMMVSSWGRFYCTTRKKFIKPYIHKSRANVYWRINIGKRQYMTHVIVAIYFVKRDCPTKTQVEHDDNNTLNPNRTNLRWVTQSENLHRRYDKARTPKLA